MKKCGLIILTLASLILTGCAGDTRGNVHELPSVVVDDFPVFSESLVQTEEPVAEEEENSQEQEYTFPEERKTGIVVHPAAILPEDIDIEEVKTVVEAFTRAVLNKDFDTIRSMLEYPEGVSIDDVFISDSSLLATPTFEEASEVGDVAFEDLYVVINTSGNFDPAYSDALFIDAKYGDSQGFGFFIIDTDNGWKVANAKEWWYLSNVSFIIPSGFEKVTYNDKVIDDRYITDDAVDILGFRKKYTLPVATSGEHVETDYGLDNRIGLYLNEDDEEPLYTICTRAFETDGLFDYDKILNREALWDANNVNVVKNASNFRDRLEVMFTGLTDAYNNDNREQAKEFISPNAPSDFIDRLWDTFDKMSAGESSMVIRVADYIDLERRLDGDFYNIMYNLTPTIYYLPDVEVNLLNPTNKEGYFAREEITILIDGNANSFVDCDKFTLYDIIFEES